MSDPADSTTLNLNIDDAELTLRDRFAMAAMASAGGHYPSDFAREAYILADAMLKERLNEPVQGPENPLGCSTPRR